MALLLWCTRRSYENMMKTKLKVHKLYRVTKSGNSYLRISPLCTHTDIILYKCRITQMAYITWHMEAGDIVIIIITGQVTCLDTYSCIGKWLNISQKRIKQITGLSVQTHAQTGSFSCLDTASPVQTSCHRPVSHKTIISTCYTFWCMMYIYLPI